MDKIDLLSFFNQQPQRIKPIFYVLIGKRTISNLLAGRRNHYLNYFRAAPTLAQTTFNRTADVLIQEALITETAPENYILTVKGKQYWQDKRAYVYRLKKYDGLFVPDLDVIDQLLGLAVQVTSNFVHGQTHYIPVSNAWLVQRRVQHWFRHYKRNPDFAQQFMTELAFWLAQLPTAQANADYMAATFQGYQVGWSDLALTDMFGLTPLSQHFMRLDNLTNLVQLLKQKQQALPMIYMLLKQAIYTPNPISISAQKTWLLFGQGYPLSRIAARRHLKPSTIREHLLEVALLNDQFDFKRLISQDDLPASAYFTERMKSIQEME
ncbi:helix-turn-helix domain-containing protein [Lactobacillus sp. CC-MHH1034]|uniref:helix-turn-helix domain-containing protein n=1 Tax=Agrilactobacillus fermenti TaxID=2586909 RepID=UPI001E313C68|nr:helix-turn-helix domain-containing protein [Agrilactobacillus fermenti]MCD2255216.1 helix-turn-helix domain-containing protein [Agrilactobacillus fermenti]